MVVRHYYTYILASKKNGTLYIGYTSNLFLRVIQHKLKMNRCFTSRYNIHMLVYYELHYSSYSAFVRERQIKTWKRKWKIELIEKDNPEWNDFAEGWEKGVSV